VNSPKTITIKDKLYAGAVYFYKAIVVDMAGNVNNTDSVKNFTQSASHLTTKAAILSGVFAQEILTNVTNTTTNITTTVKSYNITSLNNA